MLIPKQIRRPRHPVFLVLVGTLACVGAILSLNSYQNVYQSGVLDLVEHANTFALFVDANHIRELDRSTTDIGTEAYETTKQQLSTLRSENHDIHFVYIVGVNESGTPQILADSESPSSDDYSPPGQSYDEAPAALRQSTKDGVPRSAVYSDRWGHWVSAFAPIRDESGALVALIGVDEEEQDLINNAIFHAAVPALSILLLIIIIIGFQIVRTRELEFIEKKAEFLSLASHEIRSPLTGIRWAIEGLFEDNGSGLNDESRETLHIIYNNCNMLLSRVNNILDVAALEQSKQCTLEPVELRHYLTEITSGLELTAKQRNITIQIDESIDDKLVVVFDSQLMRHVFFNLISNAVKYTNESTAVTISYVSEGAYNVFKIADQGNGISKEDQARIFNGYERAKQEENTPHKEGTGLGLFLVKRVAELHKGTATVTSEAGKGTTFIIRIPA